MTTIYRATDLDTGRLVAIKIPHTQDWSAIRFSTAGSNARPSSVGSFIIPASWRRCRKKTSNIFAS